MKDFKDFLIRLQTFDIKIVERKIKDLRPPFNTKKADTYDLTHENVAMTPSFENDLFRMKELAIMDLFNLPQDQIKAQVKRLYQLKERFNKFESRYYSTYRGLEPEERKIFFAKLNLQENFIVDGTHPDQFNIQVTDQFLDDLYDSMVAKREALLKLEEEIYIMINKDNNVKPEYLLKINCIISEENINDLALILKPYFNKMEGFHLYDILKNQASGPITFNGHGIQLADAYKQLYEANIIIGCTKAKLQTWIKNNFNYLDKGNIKSFTDKYLSDIISSNTKICQSPILEIQKKENGQYGIFPALRKNKFQN